MTTQPFAKWCPRELQVKWGLIKEGKKKKEMNQEMTEPERIIKD